LLEGERREKETKSARSLGRRTQTRKEDKRQDSLDNTISLLESLLHPDRSPPLLPSLRLGDLPDRPRVESSLLGLESLDGLLGDGDVRLVVLGLVVEEPVRKIVLGVEGVSSETVVDELSEGLLSVDELGGEGDSLSGVETSI